MASNRQAPPRPEQAPPSTPQTDEKWDEERIEASLKHLHELHIKLRKLRSTIPRMFEPGMEAPEPNSEAPYAAYLRAVQRGLNDVKEFKSAMTDETTTKILERSRQTRKNPLGIKPWRPRDDPNWTSMQID